MINHQYQPSDPVDTTMPDLDAIEQVDEAFNFLDGYEATQGQGNGN
jgi:hypothetical protein